jgi:hypothetical protein
MELPPPPSNQLDPFDTAMHYVAFYEAQFARTRDVVKRHANQVVILTAIANGVIAVIGAWIAIGGSSWLGLGSTAIAASIGVLAAWNGLFHHSDLWLQRSRALNRIQRVKREAEFARAAGRDRTTIGDKMLAALNEVLVENIEAWTALRVSKPEHHEDLGGSNTAVNDSRRGHG